MVENTKQIRQPRYGEQDRKLARIFAENKDGGVTPSNNDELLKRENSLIERAKNFRGQSQATRKSESANLFNAPLISNDLASKKEELRKKRGFETSDDNSDKNIVEQ